MSYRRFAQTFFQKEENIPINHSSPPPLKAIPPLMGIPPLYLASGASHPFWRFSEGSIPPPKRKGGGGSYYVNVLQTSIIDFTQGFVTCALSARLLIGNWCNATLCLDVSMWKYLFAMSDYLSVSVMFLWRAYCGSLPMTASLVDK